MSLIVSSTSYSSQSSRYIPSSNSEKDSSSSEMDSSLSLSPSRESSKSTATVDPNQNREGELSSSTADSDSDHKYAREWSSQEDFILYMLADKVSECPAALKKLTELGYERDLWGCNMRLMHLQEYYYQTMSYPNPVPKKSKWKERDISLLRISSQKYQSRKNCWEIVGKILNKDPDECYAKFMQNPNIPTVKVIHKRTEKRKREDGC